MAKRKVDNGTNGADNENYVDVAGIDESESGDSGSSTDSNIVDSGSNNESTNGSGKYVDPESGVTLNADGTPRKKRGRKPGTRNTAGRKTATQTSSDISAILFTLHMFAAKAIDNDLIELTKEECEELGSAITRVTELYEVPLMSEKQMAIIHLAIVAGNIYGTRIMVAAMQSKSKSAEVINQSFEVVR